MLVLIDGYNLLHAGRNSLRGASNLSRSRLCEMLGDWCDAAQARITIVFDGRTQRPQLAEQLGDPRIEVIESGFSHSADDRMTEFLDRFSGARDVLVVTSDREIQRVARRRRADIVRSEDFFERLIDDLRQRPRNRTEPDQKEQGLSEGSGHAWLNDLGFAPDASEPFEHP